MYHPLEAERCLGIIVCIKLKSEIFSRPSMNSKHNQNQWKQNRYQQDKNKKIARVHDKTRKNQKKKE
eukprot:snap_masked-scaffold_53-processed-gene-1.44-mRNA-1 protein AED:1.00 eAED:1.00 QI:0/0/0/0/1/1/2/0/66